MELVGIVITAAGAARKRAATALVERYGRITSIAMLAA
jgi:hypothetical protein